MFLKNKVTAIISLLIVFILILSSCTQAFLTDKEKYPLCVSFVDVGQGDGILIECEDYVVAVDGGEQDESENFIEYLLESGVTTIDYYIATHPHSDHIGAIPDVFAEFEVKTFVMNTFSEMNIPTTKTYENMLNAVELEDCDIVCPQPGDIITLGEMTLSFFAPVEETDDYNNMSLVFKLEYGSTSFLFTGDAEKSSENLILESGFDVNADVLKVGHHGSSTSTGAAFLDAVSPEYAVVSCGQGNKYGHPHDETMSALEEYGATVFRTDTDGTIVIYSDGTDVIPG